MTELRNATVNNDTASTFKIYKRQRMDTKKRFLFCIMLTYSYLCKSNDGYGNNKYYFKI